MAKDYYKILGVSEKASQDEIKRAYKELAKKYHPDLNKSDGAEDTFKEVNEAYKVVGDEKSRQQYDQFGTADQTGFQGGGAGFDFHGFDINDIFEGFFGGSGRRSGPRKGSDLRYDMEITLEDCAFGSQKTVSLEKKVQCTKCHGKGGTDIDTCKTCRGSGYQQVTRRTPFGLFSSTGPCSDCKGAGEVIKHKCSECSGAGRIEKEKKITINIPAGIEEGMSLRVPHEGEAGEKNAQAGDLFVVVHVKKHSQFVRKEDDLYVDIPISFVQAVFGDEIEVPPLKGKARLKIPTGTQTGTLFRLKEHGIKHLEESGTGDEFVRAIVQVPTKLSKKQKELLEQFAKASGDDINPQKGFFSKLKEAFE